jgi:hypothetical protein
MNPDDITVPGFYWYLDAFGTPPHVVEVVASGDELMVRFAGREGEDALEELSGSFVGPLRPPGSHQNLSEAEHKAVQAELARTSVRTEVKVKDIGEGHPTA